jgi:protein-S-isoprenylcysteine O-methyltransferase Ste14
MSALILRRWVFRWRGYFLLPGALLAVSICRPTVSSYVLGLCVAAAGEALRIWGVGYSGGTTRSSDLAAPYLITGGPYAYVRNPLYLGNSVTALGFAVIASGGFDWATRSLLLSLIVCTYISVYAVVVPVEEDYLRSTYGIAYAEYMRLVPRVMPQIKPYPRPQGHFNVRHICRSEIYTIALFALVLLFMTFRLMR